MNKVMTAKIFWTWADLSTWMQPNWSIMRTGIRKTKPGERLTTLGLSPVETDIVSNFSAPILPFLSQKMLWYQVVLPHPVHSLVNTHQWGKPLILQRCLSKLLYIIQMFCSKHCPLLTGKMTSLCPSGRGTLSSQSKLAPKFSPIHINFTIKRGFFCTFCPQKMTQNRTRGEVPMTCCFSRLWRLKAPLPTTFFHQKESTPI